jgi:excisionase family DNA binding protein
MTTSAHTPAYLTIDEVSTVCRVSGRTVRNWIRSGRLPAYKLGPKTVRISVNDLAEMMEPIGRSA